MDEPELSVTEVSLKLQVAKSTAHRLLTSLASEGFVYKDPHSNLYSLGSSILSLTEIVNSQIPISNEAMPILHMIVESIGENAHLTIVEGLDIVYLQTISGPYSSDDLIHLGNRKPAFATCAGQAILAFHPHLAEQAAQQLHPFTKHTIVSKADFFNKLQSVRQLHYSICVEEYRAGISAIGVPVFNESDEVIASLSITAHTKRMSSEKMKQQTIALLQKGAAQLHEMITLRKRRDQR